MLASNDSEVFLLDCPSQRRCVLVLCGLAERIGVVKGRSWCRRERLAARSSGGQCLSYNVSLYKLASRSAIAIRKSKRDGLSPSGEYGLNGHRVNLGWHCRVN